MNHEIEIVTVAEMAEVDRLALAAGTPGLVLMDRAGRAVADGCEPLLRAARGRRVLVLCGPGNNGGDGFVAADLLRQRGYAVTVAAARQPTAMTGDAGAVAARWTAACSTSMPSIRSRSTSWSTPCSGPGLSRPLEGVRPRRRRARGGERHARPGRRSPVRPVGRHGPTCSAHRSAPPPPSRSSA